MILGPYVVSKHAIEQYEERVGVYSKMNTKQCINQDLHFTRIKKIVKKPDGIVHVFVRNNVEFIFEKHKNRTGFLILKTVIKRHRYDNHKGIYKREKRKFEEYVYNPEN